MFGQANGHIVQKIKSIHKFSPIFHSIGVIFVNTKDYCVDFLQYVNTRQTLRRLEWTFKLYDGSDCLVMVEWLFLAVSWGCLWFVIVVFPDHTHLLFLKTYL